MFSARPLPIFVQLLAGMFLIAVLAIALTNLFNFRVTSELVLNRTADSTQESVEQLSAKIDVLLRQYDQASQMIVFDERVQQALRRSAEEETVDPLVLRRFMATKIRHISPDILIHLFDRAGNAYSSNESLQFFWRSYDEMSSVTWYGKMERMDGHMLWVYGPAWRDGEIPAIIGGRKLKDPNRLDTLGEQYVVVPVEKINRIIGEIGHRVERKVQVMDSSGNIVYSTEPREIGTAADQGLFSKFGGSTQPFFEWTTREEQERMFVAHAISEYSGWTTIAYFKPEAVYSDASRLWLHVLLTMAAGIAIALVLVAYFTWTLTQPIRELADGLDRIGRGGIRKIHKPFASREISRLYATYNSMVQQLEEVVERLSEQQISAQRAELVALKAQFRPHFLYNSLNLIYWTIEDGRPEEAQEMTLALSELLRYSVRPSGELVALGEDLAQLERYLLLQRWRYGNRFTIRIEVEEGLERWRVIRLMLQPLVENAFRHGLEQTSVPDWHIRLRIRAENGTMLCTVEDNGVGLTPPALQQLEERIRGGGGTLENGGGIGLSNLHRQIQAYFGPSYGLRLAHSPLGGLAVILTMPLYDAEPTWTPTMQQGGDDIA